MALELIVNLLLIAGGIFCFVNVSTTMPHSAVNELGAEQWPQAILVLMLIALVFNVIRFFKINKKEDIEAAFKDFFPAPVGEGRGGSVHSSPGAHHSGDAL